MKIDYHSTVRSLIDKIYSESTSYNTWQNAYWRDRVKEALVKGSKTMFGKAEELKAVFKNIDKLTESLDNCKIDDFEKAADRNYIDCTRLESDIISFKAASDAIGTV